MNKEQILKQLKETHPLLTWKVSKEGDKFIIDGAYTMRASTMIDETILNDSHVSKDIISDVGDGYYYDLRKKVINFEG